MRVTSDDGLDPERRARLRAFERHERVERLGWVVAAVFAIGGLVLFTPRSWWLWLVPAIAAWWLVGFLLHGKNEDESLGHRLLSAPLAPLALIFFAPLLLPRKDEWTGRKIRTQLRRIAPENIRFDKVVDGNMIIHDFCPAKRTSAGGRRQGRAAATSGCA